MQDQQKKPAGAAAANDPRAADEANDPQRQAALARRARDRKNADAAPGVAACNQLLQANCKDAAKYAELIQKYPGEKDAILQALTQKLPEVAKAVQAQADGGGGDKGDDQPLLHKEIKAGEGEVDLTAGFDGENATASADYKQGDKSAGVGGQVDAKDPSKFEADVHGQTSVGKDKTLSAKAGVQGDGGKLGATGEVDYKDPKNSLSATASGSDKDNYDLGLSGSRELNDKTTLNASLDHSVADGAATDKATAGVDYKSDELAASGELDLSKTDSGLDGGVKGSATATLKDGKLYGTAMGGLDLGPDGTHYDFGGGLTITPTEKTALTAAGVMDQNGAIDLRLELDVFKNKVAGAGELEDAKKSAMLSLFVGYKNGMGGGSPLDDSMGAGTLEKQNDQGVYAGLTLRF